MPSLGSAQNSSPWPPSVGDRHGHRLLQPAAQEDHPPLPAPPLQAQFRLPAPPALTGILPVAGAHRLLQETAHPARQAQLEQVVHPLLLAAAHVALAAPVLVAAHQRRPALRRQPVETIPQMRLGMLGAVAVAGFHRNVQDQTYSTHHGAVVGVRGPSGLQRIVADHGTLLAAVKRLDRRVDVENPRLGQQRPHRLVEVAGEPARPASASILSSPRRTASSLTTLVMPNSGGSTVSPLQRRDVRIAPVSGQDRQNRRAQHIALRRRIRARVDQRAVRHQGIEPAAQLQVFSKEGQVSERRYRGIRVPFHLHRTGIGIDHHRAKGGIPLNAG